MKSFNLPASNKPASNEELSRWQERVTRRYPMRITRDISVEHEIRRRELKDMAVEPQLRIPILSRFPRLKRLLEGGE